MDPPHPEGSLASHEDALLFLNHLSVKELTAQTIDDEEYVNRSDIGHF
jgi:hypothetical protein